jgi:hypothetical protein
MSTPRQKTYWKISRIWINVYLDKTTLLKGSAMQEGSTALWKGVGYVIGYRTGRLPRTSSVSFVIPVSGRYEAKLYRNVDFGRCEKPDGSRG